MRFFRIISFHREEILIFNEYLCNIQIMKLTVRIILTWLLLTLLFTGALAAVFAIPKAAIDKNTRLSVQQVIDNGNRLDCELGMLQPWKLGDFSDCVILGIAWCADDDHPLQSAMSARFMMQDGSAIQGARLMFDDDSDQGLQSVVYCRYWHGNQEIVKPLLCITTVHGIRIINFILLSLLWLAMLLAMWRRVDHASTLIVMLILAAVMIPSVPLCMNYVPTFYIALIASLLILLWKRCTSSWNNTVLTFFVIGALTTFFDLLTTPMVAMAVPLTVYMLYRRPERPCRAVILLALAWLLGYASLWATKWLLAAIVTGHDAFSDALGAVTQRTLGHGEQDYMQWCLKWTATALLAVILAITLYIAPNANRRKAVRQHGWMLLIAASSFVWAFVLLEHTWHHLHFTWRTFSILLTGIALFVRHTLSSTERRFS